MARRCSPCGRGRKPWGPRPGPAAPRLVRARGGGGGGVAGSSSVRTCNHSTSGLSSPAPSFQTFCRIRVRSVWSVRSLSCVSRGGRAVQSPCGRWQSGHDHKFAMHGLQNQCSCSVPPQPRSCPQSGCCRRRSPPCRPRMGSPAVDAVLHLRASRGEVLFAGRAGHYRGGGARALGGATVGAGLLPRARVCG